MVWTFLAQDRDQQRDVVNILTKFGVFVKRGEFTEYAPSVIQTSLV